jgi:hypothetical protein
VAFVLLAACQAAYTNTTGSNGCRELPCKAGAGDGIIESGGAARQPARVFLNWQSIVPCQCFDER